MIVGSVGVLIIGSSWITLGICFVLGAVFQVLYTQSLNAFLGGRDPVQLFGAKNLRELNSVIPLPIPILVLDFIAKVFMVGGVACILIILGLAELYIDSDGRASLWLFSKPPG